MRRLALACLLLPLPALAAPMPKVHIISVIADTNSVKIRFDVVPGALDYRVYDVTDPTEMKYGGLLHVFAPWNWHFATTATSPVGATNGDEQVVLPLQLLPGDFVGPGFDSNDPEVAAIAPYYAAIPSTEIEWNGLTNGVPASLVVQAVNAPGPVPPGNLTNYNNASAVAGDGVVLPSAMGGMAGMRMQGVTMPASGTASLGPDTSSESFGADRGATPDGNVTTNGQVSYCSGVAVTAHMTGQQPPAGVVCGDTAPQVIAQSDPFTVTANAANPLPSGTDAQQVFFDRFDSGTFSNMNVTDPVGGNVSYTLTTATALWQVQFTQVDINASSAFVAGHHYMDVIYDGATATQSPVVHNNHAVITLSPQPVANFAAGQILHVTYEVDSQVDGRRWFGVTLAPANDPLTSWYYYNGPINNSNTALFVEVQGDNIKTTVASPNPADPTGTPNTMTLGTWPDGLRHNPYNGGPPYQNGLGLDNRSRFDVFVSETRIATYEDGKKISDDALPSKLSYASQTRIYFPHYLYHTANEVNDLISYAPYQNFWINNVPYNDERHWNNMGFEVLPKGTMWSSLGNRI